MAEYNKLYNDYKKRLVVIKFKAELADNKDIYTRANKLLTELDYRYDEGLYLEFLDKDITQLERESKEETIH